MSMSASDTKAIVQEVASLYPAVYCVYAACALVIYDWFLCLSQEVRLIWNWHSRVTSTSLVYAFSRYAWLAMTVLTVGTNYPMSYKSCAANEWAQDITIVLGTIAFAAFSALRVYALSNKNIWLTAIIILLALPTTAMRLIQGFDHKTRVLPSPFNCSSSDSPVAGVLLSIRDIELVLRASQLATELLVIGVTWWYTRYWQLYHIRSSSSGIKYGTSISLFLIYNGSIYFLFLATVYLMDIILSTASDSSTAFSVDQLLESFYDPVTSILTCRFILSLRQFDATIASPTYSGLGSQVQEHKVSVALQFATQPGNNLPAFVTSFAHPVHCIDSSMSELDSSAAGTVDDESEWRKMDTVTAPSLETSPGSNHAPV